MQAETIREKFLQFFQEKNHVIIPAAPLVPENDPTVLFTTAGMHPLVPFLLGEKHPAGKRLANCQICLRTDDIEEVGDNVHLTFFEMLGNWSLGDYFKKEAIAWSWKFLTSDQWLNLDKEKIWVSVFSGDQDAARDEEAVKIWLRLGIPKQRILFLPKKDNWWGPAGKTGPCGPDTEMFYDNGKEKVEIWNDVFMEYNKTAEGTYEKLKQKNVDTGMGLERITAVMQNKESFYDTELFQPLLKETSKLTPKSYTRAPQPYRIIADHLKAAVFILAEGIVPSNLGQGYILRRLIRRAIVQGHKLEIKENSLHKMVNVIAEIYTKQYPQVGQSFIEEALAQEEVKFNRTYQKGLALLNKILNHHLTGKEVFELFTTYGFPVECTQDIAKEKGFKIDLTGFQKEFAKHQEISRASSSIFKGGLADHSYEVKKFHTATHLLHAALREILGQHVKQKGSNITIERLRFDFSHGQKLTAEEIQKVEDLVNKKIKQKIPVICQEMSLAKAQKQGAIGLFTHKYGQKVKVYTIADFSKEICGGPHVDNTSELGRFKIIKEEAVATGIRRIKAALT